MNAVDFKKAMLVYLVKHSRFEPDRKYLGMSQIHECPARIYRQCLLGRRHEMGEKAAQRAARGYLFEGDALKRAVDAGLAKPDSGRELVADFGNGRFRGHTDGETVDGDLLEIKSCKHENFIDITRTRQAMPAHVEQAQLYMRFGNYSHGVIFYVSSETFEFYAVDVWPNDQMVERLIEKAKSILAAIDGNGEPACTCGRCFGFSTSPAQVGERPC